MKQDPFESWEEEFLVFCKKYLDEEPLYPYDHLWEKGFTPGAAFKRYLEENPDYEEKFQELSANFVLSADKAPEQQDIDSKTLNVLDLAKKIEAKTKQKHAEEKLEKFCPNCARIMGTKKICKCGYNRKSSNIDSTK